MAPSQKEIVAKIRELESKIAANPKQSNDILLLKQHLNSTVLDVKLASLHALRRLFVTFLDSGRLTISQSQHGKSTDNKSSGKDGHLRDYKLWLQQQLQGFQQNLCEFVQAGDESVMAPAIRTLIELVKREWLIQRGGSDKDTRRARFGIRTYSALILALLRAKEIDVDVLLFLRSEVLGMSDCAYYAWIIIKRTLRDSKREARNAVASGDKELRSNATKLIQNALDLLRVITPPDESAVADGSSFLVNSTLTMKIRSQECKQSEEEEEEESSISGDDEEELDAESVESVEAEEEEEEDEEQDLKLVQGKRKQKQILSEQDTKRQRISAENVRVSGKAHDPKSHKKVFSEAWLALLAMPLSLAQHKLVLKHLPEHIMPYIANPLLLADYLYRGYASGGVVSVLALQSVFTLIVQYNLDYPRFFDSLYALCTVEVFCAKYRSRFLSLLHASLKSVNIPAYTVAAFVKRLSQLALLVPAPCANYCIMQSTWLLRQHKQCHVLLHRDAASNNNAESSIYLNSIPKELESLNSMKSSLWEAETLQQHYLHSVAVFSKSLESTASTSAAPDAPYLNVSDYIDHTYETLIDLELSRAKKTCALAFVKPSKLMLEEEFLSGIFGSAKN